MATVLAVTGPASASPGGKRGDVFYLYCTPIDRAPGYYCTPADGNDAK